jgi:hypothetical protein
MWMNEAVVQCVQEAVGRAPAYIQVQLTNCRRVSTLRRLDLVTVVRQAARPLSLVEKSAVKSELASRGKIYAIRLLRDCVPACDLLTAKRIVEGL